MKSLSIISLLALGFCLLGVASVTACEQTNIVEDNQTYSIQAGEKRIISVVLNNNDRMDLAVTVAGNSPSTMATQTSGGDIGISVISPSGQSAVQYSRVESGNFIVLAEENGVYVITLDNSYSIFTPKSVTLSMRYPQR